MPDGTFADETVLVTGGAGFVGSHLAASLSDAAECRVFDDLSNGRREHVPGHATFVEGDLRDEAAVDRAMDGVDVVFHQAGMVSVPDSIERPRECHDVNGTGTLAVFEAARRNDSRVVVASSAAIYGHPDSVPVAEDAPKRPTSPYGVEKLLADEYARVYAERYDLPTVALRYFNIYGPRQSAQYGGVIETFLRQARDGEPLTVEGDGEQTRDFVFVDDVVRANRLAATTDATGTAYNVATGESVTIRELAEAIRAATDADVPIVHEDARPGDVERSRADVSRAREILDFESTVALGDGLEATLDRTD